jgi:arsenate reductase-like glutaredoxin family protein
MTAIEWLKNNYENSHILTDRDFKMATDMYRQEMKVSHDRNNKTTSIEILKNECINSINKEPKDASEKEIGYTLALKHVVQFIEKMPSDKIVQQVIDKFNQRSETGIKKYGTTLDQNNNDDFLNHLQEELMDAVLYIQKLKSLKDNE